MRGGRHILCLVVAALALVAPSVGQAAAPQEPRTPAPAAGPAPAKGEHGGGLPFSGLDIVLLTAGAAPLLLLGASLRRRQAKPAVQRAKEETLTLA